MSEDLVLVLDCGSTNVRAIAVGPTGEVVARAIEKNATEPDDNHADWHYWPFETLLVKLARCSQQVASQVGADRIKAVTVTTFGADGAFLDDKGAIMFPVISWKCPRTLEAQSHMNRYIDPDSVVMTSGVGHFSFNTLNKFIWYRENRPEILDQAKHFVFVSSLFTYRLTGRLTSDATMVGTSQMTDLQGQSFSDSILAPLGVERGLFPELIFPGDIVGPLLSDMAKTFGLKNGIPVVSAGHDTQFAIFGAGAAAEKPVLSSGTWEILMARCDSIQLPSIDVFQEAFTCEWDVLPGHYTPGFQYVASAVIEWVASTMFSELSGPAKYEAMIREAQEAPDDCYGLDIATDLLVGKGAMTGLSLNASRGVVFRAVLNGLVGRLKTGLGILEQVGGFKASELTLVGGGTRNHFWTQLKANALGIPVRVLQEPETTVLGASMFAMKGAGLYESAEDARSNFKLNYKTVMPEQSAS